MATNREEVQIKMGLDAASVKSGLSSVSNYLNQWIEKRKTSEESYSDWWKQELKKREDDEVSSAVRAAERANRARALRRQRIEERDQRREKENASILGKSNDVGGIANSVAEGMSHVAGKALFLSKVANLIEGMIDTVRENLHLTSSKDFFDWYYGVGDDEQNEKILRREEILTERRIAADEERKRIDDERYEKEVQQVKELGEVQRQQSRMTNDYELSSLR